MYGPYPWAYPARPNTSVPIAAQTEATYLNWNKTQQFDNVGWFLIPYVVDGGYVTKNIKRNDEIDISQTEFVLDNSLQQRQTIQGIKLKNANSTYYVDIYKGDYWVDTNHPQGTAGQDYLQLATVTTDTNGNVNVITDVVGVRGGFRLKSDYGLTNYMHPIINVIDYDAKGDGDNNDTNAIKSALEAAKNKGISTVYLPDGTYLIDAAEYSNLNDGIVVYEGTTLLGSPNAILRVNPNSIVGDNKVYVAISVESDTSCIGFELDGQKNLVDRTGMTYVLSRGIRVKDQNAKNLRFENLRVHDFIGIGNESFGIFLNGNSQVTYRNVEAYNIEGTGIHVNGDYLNNQRAYSVDVIDCKTYNNTMAGISVYGAYRVGLYNCESYGNATGFNIEWADASLHQCYAHENGRSIRLFGFSNATANDSYFGQSGANPEGEICIQPNEWWAGSPKLYALPQSLTLNNCIVEPTASGKPHIYMQSLANVTASQQLIGNVSTNIVLNCVGAEDWSVKSVEYDGRERVGYNLPTINYPMASKIGKVYTGILSNYALDGGVTTSAYSGGGNINPNAVTVASTTSYRGIKSPTTLKAYSKYRVKIRYKPLSSDKWYGSVEKSGSSTPKLILSGGTTNIGSWLINEFIFETDSADWWIKIQCDAITTTSFLVIDYISVAEISGNKPQSDYLIQGTIKVTFGTTAPTSGSWGVGDTCENISPTLVRNIQRWKCITAGSPGTWVAYGCGTGTTAQRPTLTANDAGYLYKDTTTGTIVFWNGSSWI